MALQIGTVTVDQDANASGGGLTRAMYDHVVADNDYSQIPLQDTDGEGQTIYPRQDALQSLANFLHSLSSGLVEYVTANAEVTVKIDPADAGLQQTPDPNDPATPTDGPGAEKTLAQKGTVA